MGCLKIGEIKKSALKRMNDCYPQTLFVMMIFLSAHLFFAIAEALLIQFYVKRGEVVDIVNMTVPTGLMIGTAIRIVGEFMVLAPINVGTAWWLIHCIRGENNNVAFILICFSNAKIYFRSLLLSFIVSVIKLAMAVPVVLCAYLEYMLLSSFAESSYHGGTYIALGVCCTIVLLCTVLLYIWLIANFCVVNFMFTMNPDEKIFNIIKQSVKAMDRNKMTVVKLVLSFIGWGFSAIFVFPMFFAVPYAALSYAILMDKIIEREISRNTADMFMRNTIARK